MIRIRFANGLCITYNEAKYLIRNDSGWSLYDKEGGNYIAGVMPGAGAIVEFSAPCSVKMEAGSPRDVVRQLAEDNTLLRESRGHDLARLKAALNNFDARTRCWK